MAPTVEIAKFVASETFIADESIINAPLASLSKVPGLLASYYGMEIQEPKYGYVVNVWESYEAHKAFSADEVNFKKLMAGFGPGLGPGGIQYVKDITFNTEDPHIALTAPTTEFALWTLKEGTDNKTFQEKLNKLVTGAISWGPAAGIHPGGWGSVHQDGNQFVVLLGWDSLEVFTKAVQSSPEALALIGELKELAELDLKHTILKKP